MDRIHWNERSITFRSLVDNPAIQKPALVQLGNKPIVVGEKINGEFLTASPCKIAGNRFTIVEKEIILSSKHPSIWRVISKSTSNKEGYIHRLTTKEIERIHQEDVQNKRATPRVYICTKDIEGFELHLRQNDPTISNGQRVERQKKYIEENVQFEITDFGEVEYTPTEGERTSQDYVPAPKTKSDTLLQLFRLNMKEIERLVRNRALRALYCTTKNEPQKRHFLLEVNEQSCDIRPIASKGSTELRYLQSTKNLFDYMLKYGNDTVLYVKLLRGDPPIKAVEFDGHMVFKRILIGDRIPTCRVEDLEVTIVSPNLPVRVRLPTDDQTRHLLPEIHTAEVQCMQVSLALLARHESEIYVTVEMEKNNFQENDDREEPSVNRRKSYAVGKHLTACDQNLANQGSISKSASDVRIRPTKPMKTSSMDEKKISKQQPRTNSSRVFHSASEKLYRDDAKRVSQENLKAGRQWMESSERSNRPPRTIIHDRSITSSSSNNLKNKTTIF